MIVKRCPWLDSQLLVTVDPLQSLLNLDINDPHSGIIHLYHICNILDGLLIVRDVTWLNRMDWRPHPLFCPLSLIGVVYIVKWQLHGLGPAVLLAIAKHYNLLNIKCACE